MKFLLLRERQRRLNFQKFEPKYIALKAIIQNQSFSLILRFEASLLLSKLILTQTKVSFKNRCVLTGRARGYIGLLNMSRIQIRDLARNNALSSISKASW